MLRRLSQPMVQCVGLLPSRVHQPCIVPCQCSKTTSLKSCRKFCRRCWKLPPGVLRGNPSDSTDAPASKHVKASHGHETHAVQHEVLAARHELSSSEAHELWQDFMKDGNHEALVAQFMQKRAQKEIPHSRNEPWLQAQVDAAKVKEWNTLIDKQAVRLVPKHKADWILKHQKHRIMGSRFVIVKKAMEDVIENGIIPDPNNAEHWKVKARFCLQGHLDPDLSQKASQGMLQSPTFSQIGRTVLFQMMSSHRWQLQLGDVQGAFLEAGPIPQQYRPLYTWVPPGGIPGAEDFQLIEVLGNCLWSE